MSARRKKVEKLLAEGEIVDLTQDMRQPFRQGDEVYLKGHHQKMTLQQFSDNKEFARCAWQIDGMPYRENYSVASLSHSPGGWPYDSFVYAIDDVGLVYSRRGNEWKRDSSVSAEVRRLAA